MFPMFRVSGLRISTLWGAGGAHGQCRAPHAGARETRPPRRGVAVSARLRLDVNGCRFACLYSCSCPEHDAFRTVMERHAMYLPLIIRRRRAQQMRVMMRCDDAKCRPICSGMPQLVLG